MASEFSGIAPEDSTQAVSASVKDRHNKPDLAGSYLPPQSRLGQRRRKLFIGSLAIHLRTTII